MTQPRQSDFIVMRAMLERAGIVAKYVAYSDGVGLEIEAKTGPRNEGYHGFACEFEFHKSGELRKVTVWE